MAQLHSPLKKILNELHFVAAINHGALSSSVRVVKSLPSAGRLMLSSAVFLWDGNHRMSWKAVVSVQKKIFQKQSKETAFITRSRHRRSQEHKLDCRRRCSEFKKHTCDVHTCSVRVTSFTLKEIWRKFLPLFFPPNPPDWWNSSSVYFRGAAC